MRLESKIQIFLIYIDRDTSRLVRSRPVDDTLLVPSALKEYNVRYQLSLVNENNFRNLSVRPYDYVFENIHGLTYSPDESVDLNQLQLINQRLEAVERLWQIAGMFIKNSSMTYLQNDLIREVVEYEFNSNKGKDVDSLIEYIRIRENVSDSESNLSLTNLKLNHYNEKKKDIIKSVLSSQDKLMSSDTPIQDMWEELKTIYFRW